MADIKLKDGSGVEQTYSGVRKLSVPAAAGGAQEFIIPNLQTKSLTVTENGTRQVTPDTGFDGIGLLNLTTNVAGGGGDINDALYQHFQALYADSGNALVCRPNIEIDASGYSLLFSYESEPDFSEYTHIMCFLYDEEDAFQFCLCGYYANNEVSAFASYENNIVFANEIIDGYDPTYIGLTRGPFMRLASDLYIVSEGKAVCILWREV